MLDCQVRSLKFKPWPRQKFVSRFLFHAYLSGTTSQWIPEPVQSLELTLSEEERVEQMGRPTDTSVIKKSMKEIQ